MLYQLELLACPVSAIRFRLLGLPVRGMGPAKRTVLPELKLVRYGPFILGGGIVPLLAARAGKGNDISHRTLSRPHRPDGDSAATQGSRSEKRAPIR